MRFLRHLWVPLVLILCMGAVDVKDEDETPPCERIMSYILDNLPESGTLCQDSAGFVYVDLDDDYIHTLSEFISEEGYELPPYFGRDELHGAHISVIYSSESKQYNIGKVKEVGETFYFKPLGCKVAAPKNWKGVDEVYVIAVQAPSLNRLRKKYGLPKAANDFHITIGVKYRQEEASQN